jgi:peptidoglycan hydrolase-like protein with peptidoglycan-binding domain
VIAVVLAGFLIAALLLLAVRTRRPEAEREVPEQPAVPVPEVVAPPPEPPPAAMPEPEPAAPSNGRDRAERVMILQQQLTALGFALGPIDGRYGPLTTQAVERFQHAYGLLADGVVGPLTADALHANAPQPPTNGRIERVKSLQRQLSWLGFEPGPADGKYGPLTTGAVKRFQAAHDLQADGIVDPTTADALRQNIAQRPTSDRIDRVKALQRQLEWLGHDPGPIDGRYGPQTTHAVKRFQQEHELAPNGIVDPTTHRALQQTLARSGQR